MSFEQTLYRFENNEFDKSVLKPNAKVRIMKIDGDVMTQELGYDDGWYVTKDIISHLLSELFTRDILKLDEEVFACEYSKVSNTFVIYSVLPQEPTTTDNLKA